MSANELSSSLPDQLDAEVDRVAKSLAKDLSQYIDFESNLDDAVELQIATCRALREVSNKTRVSLDENRKRSKVDTIKNYKHGLTYLRFFIFGVHCCVCVCFDVC